MDAPLRRLPDLRATVVPSAGVLVQELDGEAVLLNVDSDRYFCLDGIGTRIWQHLLGHRQLERVCREMHKEYDVDESRLRADVLDLVAELLAAGILTLAHDASSGTADA